MILSMLLSLWFGPPAPGSLLSDIYTTHSALGIACAGGADRDYRGDAVDLCYGLNLTQKPKLDPKRLISRILGIALPDTLSEAQVFF
jgi:hypothetical protein